MSRSLNIVALLLVVVAVTCFTGADAECSQGIITSCVAPIAVALQNGSVPSVSALGQVCGKIDGQAQCISSQGCAADDLYVVTTWNGLRDAINYLCTDQTAKDAIAKADKDINAQAVKQDMSMCNRTFTESIYNNSYSLCPASNTMLQCMAKATERAGPEAQRVMVTFMYKFLYPSANLVHCQLKDPNSLVASGSQTSRTPSLLVLTLGLMGGILWQAA